VKQFARVKLKNFPYSVASMQYRFCSEAYLRRVYGKIVDKQTNRPIENASLFLYQTDSSGIYSTLGIDRDARIKGTLYSNTSGCFKIQTILSGDYPGNKNSRHLHYVINANGCKEVTSALFFKGFTTRNLTEQEPLIILDIKKDNTGTWIGTTNFYLEKNQEGLRSFRSPS
jgi:protocatechuate 3,4-dioxygenase beta subunit